MSILIERPGILTTVQDLGRHGNRRFGINPGGVMDRAAARLLNALLGNTSADAMLEIHFPAPQIRFEKSTVIAIGGADLDPCLDNAAIRCWTVVEVRKGALLTFRGKKFGNRAYLAFASGLEVEPWLGSTSTNLAAGIGGFAGRRLQANDRIGFRKGDRHLAANTSISPWAVPAYSAAPVLRILPGAEFDRLTGQGRERLLQSKFEISKRSDRMGFRLAGEPVTLSDRKEMISSPVSFGTIQSLPDDQMILLMADHQTTGGYPRLAHVITYDLPLLAQLGSGDKVSFQLTTQSEAEALETQFARHLKFLRAGSRLLSA